MSKLTKSPIQVQNSKTEPTLSDIMKSLKTQDSKLTSIATKISIQENKSDSIINKLENLMYDIANLREENKTLKSELDTLRKRMDSLDASTKVTTVDPDFELIHEVQERMEKSKNIIIFGVNEDSDMDMDSPYTVKRIFNALSVSTPIIHATRMGKKNEKPRPILVNLASKLEVLSILKAKRKLRTIDTLKHIFIGTDQTIQQRNQYKDIKRQIDEKKQGGDNSWFIKFIDGVPTAIQKN